MSDTLRRRIAAGLLIVGVIVAVLAIEDVGPLSDPETEEAKILDVLAPVFKDSGISVRYVSVSGNRAARVEARYKLAGAGAQPRTVLLVSEDGEWRISDPG